MAFRSAQTSRLYLAGLELHAYLRTGGERFAVDMHDVTVLNDTAKEFVPGHNTGVFTASGPLEATGTGFITLSLAKALGSVNTLAWAPLGGDGAVQLFTCYDTELNPSSSVTGSVDWSFSGQITGEVDINGVVLENNTTVTADTDGTVVDNGAATSNGALIRCHTTAFSGFSSNVVTIEASTTGSFSGEETTLATLTSITGVSVRSEEVSGTVPRYLRAVDNVTGTGSTTRFIAVARR